MGARVLASPNSLSLARSRALLPGVGQDEAGCADRHGGRVQHHVRREAVVVRPLEPRKYNLRARAPSPPRAKPRPPAHGPPLPHCARSASHKRFAPADFSRPALPARPATLLPATPASCGCSCAAPRTAASLGAPSRSPTQARIWLAGVRAPNPTDTRTACPGIFVKNIVSYIEKQKSAIYKNFTLFSKESGQSAGIVTLKLVRAARALTRKARRVHAPQRAEAASYARIHCDRTTSPRAASRMQCLP